jgi:SAM-dependent methyltransferase
MMPPLAHLASAIRSRLSPKQRQRLRRVARPAWFGTLRRTTPLSDEWGFDRGTPIDRFYLEQFLADHRADIRGRTLEVRDDSYTARFGQCVERRDVLDVDPNNPRATITADLAAADTVPSDQFDCFVLTQTLQFVRDTRMALYHAHRMLRPGGVLLVTVPTASRIAPRYGLETDYWRFTPLGCAALVGERFGESQVTTRAYGNVLTSMAFLMGLSAEELRAEELAYHDPYFPLLAAVRAVKR